jgi:L-amino acid N-acyltransferase YncA
VACLVRPATEDDIERILEITNDAIAHTTANWSVEPTDLDERCRWFREHISRGYPVLVAEADSPRARSVIGFGAYGEFRPKVGYRYTVEHSVYVDGAARRGGVGSALLGALIDHATAAGIHVMIGGIASDNIASIRLHERFGFQVTGHLRQVGWKFGRWLDLLFMQRELVQPDTLARGS